MEKYNNLRIDIFMEFIDEQALSRRQYTFNDKSLLNIDDHEDLSFEGRPSYCHSQDYNNVMTCERRESSFENDHDCIFQQLKNKSGTNNHSEFLNEDKFHQPSQNENKVNFEEDRSLIDKKAMKIDKKKAKRAAKAKAFKTSGDKTGSNVSDEQPRTACRSYLHRVLEFQYGLAYLRNIGQDIDETYYDDLARKCILILYGKNCDDEITKEDFSILLKK